MMQTVRLRTPWPIASVNYPGLNAFPERITVISTP